MFFNIFVMQGLNKFEIYIAHIEKRIIIRNSFSEAIKVDFLYANTINAFPSDISDTNCDRFVVTRDGNVLVFSAVICNTYLFPTEYFLCK